MDSTENNFNTNLDLGRLSVFDAKPSNHLLELNEEYMQEQATENIKLILSELYKLKNIQNGEKQENVDYDKPANAVKLPLPTTILPRSRAIPKTTKDKTKWEQFASDRGMSKKKRSRMVYSEQMGEYLPRWGKDSKKRVEFKNTAIMDDKQKYEGQSPFTYRKQEEKLHGLKNQKRQERNDEAFMNKKRNRDGKFKENIKQDRKRIEIAQKSTASQGRFDKKLKNEQKINNLKYKKVSNDVYSSSKSEKARDSKLLSKIIRGSD